MPKLDAASKARCVRHSGNYGNLRKYHLGDDPAFDRELFDMEVKVASPKLSVLIQKIQELDEADGNKTGTTFKHMIFTDVEDTKSIKMIVAGLVTAGFSPCFSLAGKGFHLNTEDELAKTHGSNFGVLISKKYSERTMTVAFKKSMLEIFNCRPDNVDGKLIRIMILDNGYKEGIDLYDVKYVHLFDPQLPTDEKQSVGRSMRYCGQMGLKFKTSEGWPLHVFKYDMRVDDIASQLHSKEVSKLWIDALQLDIKRLAFAAELERMCIIGAVDRELTVNMHTSLDTDGPLSTLQKNIKAKYAKLKYAKTKLENKCDTPDLPAEQAQLTTTLTPTQQFVRDYFTPRSNLKGILAYHSIGSGKSCTAVATATNSFQRAGYTILFVTRTTLKADIWKNISGKVMCHEILKERIANGEIRAPKRAKPSMALAGPEWIQPLSYKQLTNMLTGENHFYHELVARNGKTDPLRKTLLIIDEAHKLYSGNSKNSEQPDLQELENWIQNSYKKSGKDSVRMLLMSGTPIVNDGMELVHLLNLLRPAKEALPHEFNDFEDKFLNESTGKFTTKGRNTFLKEIDGYISYLNRSADARYFAHPIYHDVEVPMVPYDSRPSKWMDGKVRETKEQIKEKKHGARDCKVRMKEEKAQIVQERRDAFEECMQLKGKARKECKDAARDKFDEKMEAFKLRLDGCEFQEISQRDIVADADWEDPEADDSDNEDVDGKEKKQAAKTKKTKFDPKQPHLIFDKNGHVRKGDVITFDGANGEEKLFVNILMELQYVVAKTRAKIIKYRSQIEKLKRKYTETKKRYRNTKGELKKAKSAVNKERKRIAAKYKKLAANKENKAAGKEERAKLANGPLVKAVVAAESAVKTAYTQMIEAKQTILKIQIKMGRKTIPDLSPYTRLHKRCYKPMDGFIDDDDDDEEFNRNGRRRKVVNKKYQRVDESPMSDTSDMPSMRSETSPLKKENPKN